MKKLLSLLLVLAMLLPSAMAEEIILAPDMLSLQQANQAMISQYGHTHETLGLFNVSLQRHGAHDLIIYRSNGSVPEVLTGDYIALVSSETLQLLWSYDNVDAALWQSGDLNSPAWGVKQLTAYLAESPLTRASFCTPYEEAAPTTQPDIPGGTLSVSEVNKDNRDAAEAASVLARKAVQAMYGLEDEVITRLDWHIDMTTATLHPDGHTEWFIMLQDNIPDVLDPITYYVTLNSATREILYISYFSGGIG